MNDQQFTAKKKVLNNKNIQLELEINPSIRFFQVKVELTKLDKLNLTSSNLVFISSSLNMDINIDQAVMHPSDDIIENTKTTQLIANTQLGVLGFTYLTSSFFLQILSLIANLVDAAQLCHILMYINVNYPYNLINFFYTVGKVNMNFIKDIGKENKDVPNPLVDYLFFSKEIINQRAPKKFDYTGKSSSFLLNGLTNAIMMIGTLFIFIFFKKGSDLFEKWR